MAGYASSPERWRARAEETRVLAEGMSDPEVRRRLLKIAAEYDRLAKYVQSLAAKAEAPSADSDSG